MNREKTLRGITPILDLCFQIRQDTPFIANVKYNGKNNSLLVSLQPKKQVMNQNFCFPEIFLRNTDSAVTALANAKKQLEQFYQKHKEDEVEK